MSTEENQKSSLVAYIECTVQHPGQGFVGLGVHGYIVTDQPAKKGYGLKNILPTETGYRKGESKDLKLVDRVFDGSHVRETTAPLTNPVAGLIIQATTVLQMTLDEIEKDVDIKGVYIGLSRVNLAVQMQQKFAKIAARRFCDSQGNLIPYKAEMEAYIRAFEVLTQKGVTITIENVDITELGYINAKAMAETAQFNGIARLKGRPSSDVLFSIVDANGYWNHAHGRHPLLSHSRLIFWADENTTSLPEYLWTMDYQKTNDVKKDKHKLEIEVGQLLADCRYAVVKPHEHDELLDQVAARHCQYHRETNNNLAVIYLSAVYSKKGHAYLERFGTDYLLSNTFLTELYDGSDVMYTHDMPIPRRSRRAGEVYVKLQETLKAFEAAVTPEPVITFDSVLGICIATEITEYVRIKEENAKGKVTYKPHANIEVPNTVLEVPAFYDHPEKVGEKVECKVKFSIGYDVPTRNTVAALLGDSFRAFVMVYREMDYSRRHATIIISEKGCGIWATPFAAPTFLK